MGYDKNKSLHNNICARICKKLGKPLQKLDPELQKFLNTSIDGLLKLGTISIADINVVARQAKEMMPKPEPAAPKGGSALGHNTDGARGGSAGVPQPPQTPPRRATVEKRIDKIYREAELVKQIDEDTRKYKEEQQNALIQRKQKQHETQLMLKRQVEEAQALKVQQKQDDRKNMQLYLHELQVKEEADRTLDSARRRKHLEERAKIEGFMKGQLDDKKKKQLQEKEAEKVYLDEIIEFERSRKEAELNKKKRARDELRKFLSENTENEKVRKVEAESQRAAERETIERNRAIQQAREDQARAEIKRQSVKGLAHSKRQDQILEQYETTRYQIEEKQRVEELQRQIALERRQKVEDEQDSFKKQRKSQLRSELVGSLETQIHERETHKHQQVEHDKEFRKIIDHNLAYGEGSEYDVKRRVAERKREILTGLDKQVAEKKARERRDLQVKI